MHWKQYGEGPNQFGDIVPGVFTPVRAKARSSGVSGFLLLSEPNSLWAWDCGHCYQSNDTASLKEIADDSYRLSSRSQIMIQLSVLPSTELA